MKTFATQIIKNYEFQLITQQKRGDFARKQNGDFSSVKVNSITTKSGDVSRITPPFFQELSFYSIPKSFELEKPCITEL